MAEAAVLANDPTRRMTGGRALAEMLKLYGDAPMFGMDPFDLLFVGIHRNDRIAFGPERTERLVAELVAIARCTNHRDDLGHESIMTK